MWRNIMLGRTRHDTKHKAVLRARRKRMQIALGDVFGFRNDRRTFIIYQIHLTRSPCCRGSCRQGL